MKASEVLRAARKLIERPENWCRLVNHLPAVDGKPDAFCIRGAILCAAVNPERYYRAHDVMAEALRGIPITQYNDKRGRRHSTILRAFDRAIALAEAEETETARGRG